MTALLDKLRQESERKVDDALKGYAIDPGMSDSDVDDWATDVAIDVYSDMGFNVEDTEEGETAKLYAYVEDIAHQKAKAAVEKAKEAAQ